MARDFKSLGSKKHDLVHKTWIELKKERFVPVKVYQAFGKLMNLSEAAIERGIGKLFADDHLKPPQEKKKKSKKSGGGGSGRVDPKDFS